MRWFRVAKATAASSDLSAFVNTREGSAHEWGKYRSRIGIYVDEATLGTARASLGPRLGPRCCSRLGAPLGFRLGDIPKYGTAVWLPLGRLIGTPLGGGPSLGGEARNASNEAKIIFIGGNPVGNSCNHEGISNASHNSDGTSDRSPHPPRNHVSFVLNRTCQMLRIKQVTYQIMRSGMVDTDRTWSFRELDNGG
jgi:hypothetical protein